MVEITPFFFFAKLQCTRPHFTFRIYSITLAYNMHNCGTRWERETLLRTLPPQHRVRQVRCTWHGHTVCRRTATTHGSIVVVAAATAAEQQHTCADESAKSYRADDRARELGWSHYSIAVHRSPSSDRVVPDVDTRARFQQFQYHNIVIFCLTLIF